METIWLDEPEQHDFPAAVAFLELLFSEEEATHIVTQLQKTTTIRKKAKDLLRASELPLLANDNLHVKHTIKKVKNGIKLSPILLVRGKQKLIIADGYHRLCSIYYLSEDLEVPCRIV